MFRPALFIAPLLLAPSGNAEIAPKVDRPAGDYRVVTLELSKGLRFEGKNRESQPPQTIHLAFRDQGLANWWFVRHGWEAMHQHGGDVSLTDKGITGKLNLRIYDVRGRLQLVADLEFDVGREGEKFEGDFRASVRGVVEREWEGTATGEFAAGDAALAEGAHWRNFAGPEGTLSSPGGPALIDDLRKARPLWRSEADVPVSYGNAADDRYPNRAAGCRFGGGSSSPVVADGMVFIAFYRPHMGIDPVPKPGYADKWTGAALNKYAEENRLIPEEVEAIKDHWRPIADDVVVAMDTRTGATVWKAVWPARSYNLQTHKHRGTFGVPLIAGGKVFYPNLHGRLEVMDAKTGDPLWEFPEFEKPPETKHRPGGPQSQSPLLIGDTLIWSIGETTFGLSSDSGEVVWENQIVRAGNDHSLRTVKLETGDRVLTASGRGEESHVRLIDPRSGETVWTDVISGLGCYEGLFANTLTVAADRLVAFRMKFPQPDPENGKIDKSKITYHINAWRVSEKGLGHLWEDSHLLPDEGPHLAVSDGVVFGVGKHLVRCLDLETGDMLGAIEEDDFPHPEGQLGDVPRSNPLLLVVGDKLILSPEGQHGKHGFILFESDPKEPTRLGDRAAKWVPPHATTTALRTTADRQSRRRRADVLSRR